MKCPKCGYLGFEPVERCRNCGYEFSLSSPPATPELTIRAQMTIEGALEDLPLFDDDDAPLITKASPPRTPLAVRRATPEVPRLKMGTARAPVLDLSPVDLEVRPNPPRENDSPHPVLQTQVETASEEPAGLPTRRLALVIDLVVLAAVGAAVIYLTVQICGLTVQDLPNLPWGPLVAFLVVQNFGYLVAFTLGGQTLGKMATRIKVVPASSDVPLDLGHSIVRTLIWLALAIPAGLGFLSAFLSADRRGLHDRCAGTRVVRAA